MHRDLKPGNIMLVPDPASAVGERVKLLDFGIAKLFDVSLRSSGEAAGDARTRTGAILGTPAYMAPEQCLSAGQIDGQADVYSVGAIAYQMVTGRLPYDDEHPVTLMAKKMAEPPQPLGQLGEDIPAEFPELVLSMLQVRPADRPRIDQVEDSLARMLGVGNSRRSGFLGRAAGKEQSGAQAVVPSIATARGDKEPTATVDRPADEEPLDQGLASPPWPPDLTVTARGASSTSAPPPATFLAEPTTASAPVPMSGLPRRSRSAQVMGVLTGLLVVGSGIATLAFWRRPPHLPAAPIPTASGAEVKYTPTASPAPGLTHPEDGKATAGALTPALAKGAEAAPAAAVCTPDSTDPSCAEDTPALAAETPVRGKSPVGRGRRLEHKAHGLSLAGHPGRLFVIEGATVPEQESAIRMCAKANLGHLAKLSEKPIIKLQRSGTLQLTSAPPEVYKTNLDECVRQLFLKIPAKSMPEEVTIRVAR